MPLLTLLWVFWGNLRYESKYQITDCIWISLQWRSAKSATCSSQIKFLGVLHKTFPSPSSDVHSGAKFERQFWISWPPGGALLDKFPKSGRRASALWPPGWDKTVTLTCECPSVDERGGQVVDLHPTSTQVGGGRGCWVLAPDKKFPVHAATHTTPSSFRRYVFPTSVNGHKSTK